jgi:hypothetical protein
MHAGTRFARSVPGWHDICLVCFKQPAALQTAPVQEAEYANKADRENGAPIMRDDFAERDLVHIRNVLSHLEHSADSVRAMEKATVVNLNYWRGRVRAILAIPLLSTHVEKQAKDLLGRLDRLESAGP